jgi:hypothetical protein
LDTKGAFFHSTLHSGSVSQIVDRGVYFLFGNVWFCPVEDSSFIGACSNAIPAPDTPVVINYDDAIWFLPGRMDRAYLHTRRILTLLTLNRHIDKPLLWDHVRIIVMFRVFEIDEVPPLESENPDPMKLRIIA